MPFKDPERKRAYQREYMLSPEAKTRKLAVAAERRESRRRFLRAVKLTAGCIDCEYREHFAALQFDHHGPKRFDAKGMASRSMEAIIDELQNCEVRCANCHAIRHA